MARIGGLATTAIVVLGLDVDIGIATFAGVLAGAFVTFVLGLAVAPQKSR